jgi:hypothetical protein
MGEATTYTCYYRCEGFGVYVHARVEKVSSCFFCPQTLDYMEKEITKEDNIPLFICFASRYLFPSRSLPKPLRLVVSSPPPGRIGAALVSVATQSWQRDGAGSRYRCCFSLVFTYIEIEGRSTVLGGQICCVMGILLLAARR